MNLTFLWVYQFLSVIFCEISINVLHFNDVHSRVEPSNIFASTCSDEPESPKCFGGMARQKTIIDMIRKSSENPTIVLDAGDQFMGTLWNTFYQGSAAAQLQNLMGLDAMQLGNHEFDFKEDVLVDYLKQVDFPVLGACNIVTTNEELASRIKKWVIKDVSPSRHSPVKVGIVGTITPDTRFNSQPGPGTRFVELVPALNACISEMKEQEDVDIVIALGHNGIFDDEKIAKGVEGVDIVIGGHTHTFLYSPIDDTPLLIIDDGEEKRDTAFGEYPVMVDSEVSPGKKIPVFQAFWAGRYMGNFVATFDGDFNLVNIDGQPILLNDKIDFDLEALDVINELKGPLIEYGEEVIGEAAVLLDGTRELVRGAESNLGNSICDGIMWYMKNLLPGFEKNFGPIDIAIQHGGGIRASIEKGDVVVRNVQEVLPFGNIVSVKAVSGVDVISMLENSVALFEKVEGRFLQVAGIKYAHDPSLQSGSRIVGAALVVDGCDVALDPCTTYNVAVNGFLAGGGDEFEQLGESETLLDIGPVLATVYQNYITENTPIQAEVEGRIINCLQTPDEKLCNGCFAPQRTCE